MYITYTERELTHMPQRQSTRQQNSEEKSSSEEEPSGNSSLLESLKKDSGKKYENDTADDYSDLDSDLEDDEETDESLEIPELETNINYILYSKSDTDDAGEIPIEPDDTEYHTKYSPYEEKGETPDKRIPFDAFKVIINEMEEKSPWTVPEDWDDIEKIRDGIYDAAESELRAQASVCYA